MITVAAGDRSRRAVARRVGAARIDAGDDARLLAALRAQDPAVADPLWRRFAPTIFRQLRRVLGPWAPVEDVVQVVLLCVFHRGHRLGPRADLTRFIVRTTARIARTELRSRASRWPAATWRALGPGRATARETADQDAVQRFYRVLDHLDAVDRIAFVFHYVEGLDAHEVAAAIGGSPAGTNRRLRRSLGQVIAGIERDPVLRQIRRPLPS